MCNHTSPEHPHPAAGLSETSYWTADETMGLRNQRNSAQTVRNRLREVHLLACRPHQGLDLTAVGHRN